MALIVKYQHGNLIGRPIERTKIDGPQIGTFNDYFKNLPGGWKNAIEDGLRTFEYLRWNGKTYGQNKIEDINIRGLLIDIVRPIIRNGQLPKTLPTETLTKLGTPNMEKFEDALYDLIQEILRLDEAEKI